MASQIQNNFRARKSFAKIGKIIDIPNLIDIQKQSYEKFLQKDVPIEKREDVGLQGVFKSVFPIKDFSETSSIEFVSYTLDKPKYDVDECRQRGMTFAAPIKVTVRLVVWDTNEETGSQSIRDVKEQEVFFGEIPLMTDNGTFIINGTERAQQHRRVQLAPPIDADVEQVLGVELEVQPRAAVGDDPRAVEELARGVGLPLVVVVEHAGAAVQLADHHALRSVDDERAVVGHERDLAEEDLLLLDVADRLRPGLFIGVPDHQAHDHLDGRREGHAALPTLLHVVLGLVQVVGHEHELARAVKFAYREKTLENAMQSDVGALRRLNV